MNSIWTGDFWKGTAERAISTAAQTGASLLSVDLAGILDVEWESFGSAVALAAVLSVLKSVAAGKLTGTASLTGSETPTDQVAAQVAVEQAPPPELVAGPASNVPDGTPVDVTPQDAYYDPDDAA